MTFSSNVLGTIHTKLERNKAILLEFNEKQALFLASIDAGEIDEAYDTYATDMIDLINEGKKNDDYLFSKVNSKFENEKNQMLQLIKETPPLFSGINKIQKYSTKQIPLAFRNQINDNTKERYSRFKATVRAKNAKQAENLFAGDSQAGDDEERKLLAPPKKKLEDQKDVDTQALLDAKSLKEAQAKVDAQEVERIKKDIANEKLDSEITKEMEDARLSTTLTKEQEGTIVDKLLDEALLDETSGVTVTDEPTPDPPKKDDDATDVSNSDPNLAHHKIKSNSDQNVTGDQINKNSNESGNPSNNIVSEAENSSNNINVSNNYLPPNNPLSGHANKRDTSAQSNTGKSEDKESTKTLESELLYAYEQQDRQYARTILKQIRQRDAQLQQDKEDEETYNRNVFLQTPDNKGETQQTITSSTVPNIDIETTAEGTIPNQQSLFSGINNANETVAINKEKILRNKKTIETLIQELKSYHLVYDDNIPQLSNKEHQKRYRDAIKSNDIDIVKKHHEEMDQLIREYYKTTSLKIGVIYDVSTIPGALQSNQPQRSIPENIITANDINNKLQTPSKLQTVLSRTDPFGKAIAGDVNPPRGGLHSHQQQPIKRLIPKSGQFITQGQKIYNPIGGVDAPYQYVLKRPSGEASINLRIKGGCKNPVYK